MSGAKGHPARVLAGGLRFATLEELLDFLPEDERDLTLELRELILSEVPDLKERISFNVPFYKLHRDICFLWPASVLWGARKTYVGVRFGLSYGSLVPGAEPFLQRGARKQVCWRDLTTITPADQRQLGQLLRSACTLDAERARGLR
ncbi:MAG: DUF1801 domain-containing protein [Flavobacteriales bacterium]